MSAITFFNRLYKFELLFHTQVNTAYVQSIDDHLLDFSGNMNEKRVEYFRKALTIPLDNIRYVTLCMTRGGFEDVGEWYSSEEEDLGSDSEKDD